jgi:hypothetical protein
MRRIAAITVLCIVMAVGACSTTLAESWSSFKDAAFTGISLHPMLATSKLEYTVTLDPGATVSFGGNTYDINWIGGFYVRTTVETDHFNATNDSTSNDWTWDQNPTHGPDFQVVGWKATGNADRLHVAPGAVKKFYFGTLDLGPTDVTTAFHIGYLDDTGKAKTDFFSGSVPDHPVGNVPEPSGVLAGMTFLAGAGLIGRRRLRGTP